MSDIDPTVPVWPTGSAVPGGTPDAPATRDAPDASDATERKDATNATDGPDDGGSPGSPPWTSYFGGARGATAIIGLVAALIAVLVVALVASHEAAGYYLFSPGTAPVITLSGKCELSGNGELFLPDGTPCVRLVLPRGKAHDIDGELMMVDVEVGPAGPVDWLEYEAGLLGRSRQLYPVAVYAGPTPTSELGCQDTEEMVDANEDSALAALAQLHYKVAEDFLGAQIDAVYAGTPAWRAGLKCNDLITAVNGEPVQTAKKLTDLLARMGPGTTVTFTDHPANGGRTRQVKVKLISPPESALANGFTGRSYMGVEIEPRVKLVLPFPVSVDAAGIGGPSAGLAFTLGILDALSNGKLTGGHRIAATGTIEPDGAVGDVGGVQEKTVAVEKAGAQVFFVPEVEYAVAESIAGKNLRVIPVTTLGQVLQVLRKDYGGGLPAQGGAG